MVPEPPAPGAAADIDPEGLAATLMTAVDAGTRPGSDDAPAVLVTDLTKSFGSTPAVAGVTLSIPRGSFFGLVGPNGAGKTTTLSMIAGLLRPDAGSIRILDVDARTHEREAKRLIGVLPDRFRTFDRLTGRQLLHYAGVLREVPAEVVASRADDLARAFDIEDALGRTVADYSAGMAKKIMLACALIHAPRVLVLDEPFEAVDPVSSAAILDILGAYVRHGGTVILSSHGMQTVERVCDRVAVIADGRVVADGTVAEVRGDRSLEERFIELVGGRPDVGGLEWLHGSSD
jgi:ABC-2 type transport system ATP-binding protein